MAVWQKQKYEDVVMPMKYIDSLPVELIVGAPLEGNIKFRPMQPYANESIDFLSELSFELLRNQTLRKYPDIASFAYWCRESNLRKMSECFDRKERRIGRGLVFHVTPSNVPISFAFSLAFGLLAGNANIVRVTEKYHEQTLLLCQEISRILKQAKHSLIAGNTRIIKYPRNDKISAEISKICHARLLWGGNSTVNHLRSMQVSPRSVDVCFPDRYSLCIFNAESLLNADSKTMNAIIQGFYNDVFLLDQNACSSPHLILWQGTNQNISTAKKMFWGCMNAYLKEKPTPPAIYAVDKYTHLCRLAIALEGITTDMNQINSIYRVELEVLPADIENYRASNGFFIESTDNDLSKFENIVGESYQTVTYFGVNPEIIIDKIISKGMLGVDRVVKVGRALDIGIVWDGYDLITTLSRIISTK